jgi:hypothetical protein
VAAAVALIQSWSWSESMFVSAVWSLVELTNKKFGIKLRLGSFFSLI